MLSIWIITFGLACILCGAVCFGLTIAIIAGIAYGYNYCMAEFITFTRSDVTVYMRRGQFYDRPDLPMVRRSGEEDLFGLNRTTDYEESVPNQGKPLSDTWMKSQDTRKYAEKLTKYSPPKTVENPPQRTMLQDPIVPSVQFVEPPRRKSAESQVISIVPNVLMTTESWQSGVSTIVMRNFKPMQEISRPVFGMPHAKLDDLSPSSEPGPKSFGFISGKHKDKNLGASKINIPDAKERYVPMRSYPTSMRPLIPEYFTEEIDEDNIVYKPV